MRDVTRRTFLQGVAVLALAAAMPVPVLRSTPALPSLRTARYIAPVPRDAWEDPEYDIWAMARPHWEEAFHHLGIPLPLDKARLRLSVIEDMGCLTDDDGQILFDGNSLVVICADYDA